MATYQEELNKLKRYFMALINISTNLYKNEHLTSSLMKYYIEKETYLVRKLNDDEIRFLIYIINKNYKLDEKPSLLDDIININELNPPIERINFILYEQLHTKSIHDQSDPLLLKLVNVLKDIFTCRNEFEYNLRKIYLTLLEKHISSSNGMSDNYLKHLQTLIKILKFKYPNIWYQNIYIPRHNYEKDNIMVSYLHQKLKK